MRVFSRLQSDIASRVLLFSTLLEGAKMKVAVSGSTGLVGSALVKSLTANGHHVVRLVRPGSDGVGVSWDPARGTVDVEHLQGLDAAVHLAGVSIAGGRWNAARKAAIRASRVDGTRTLATALAALTPSPESLICASAVGYYGDRGDELLDERVPPGTGFLPALCREWEAAAEPARAAGIRVVHTRFGLVLSADGGALPSMLVPFRMGVGGTLGSGRQYMSWISIDDVVGVIEHALDRDSISGPVNTVAPTPVRNAEFTRTLAEVLGRPAFMRVPAFAVRLLLGEMADELLFASARVLPAKLRDTGYRFRHPLLAEALRHVLAPHAPR
jgi:uncharacterized protein